MDIIALLTWLVAVMGLISAILFFVAIAAIIVSIAVRFVVWFVGGGEA